MIGDNLYPLRIRAIRVKASYKEQREDSSMVLAFFTGATFQAKSVSFVPHEEYHKGRGSYGEWEFAGNTFQRRLLQAQNPTIYLPDQFGNRSFVNGRADNQTICLLFEGKFATVKKA
jgi:hypothetical protein